jgi:nicotinamide-nucleotide amidase
MATLSTPADSVAALLKQRGDTVGVAESSTGGLISSSLLAVPGASAYFLGGTVIYTNRARNKLLGIEKSLLERQEPMTEAYVALCAQTIREQLHATWGLAELGAAGPAATPYGHAPGLCVLGVDGPIALTRRIETGSGDREANMKAFMQAAFDLFLEALQRVE